MEQRGSMFLPALALLTLPYVSSLMMEPIKSFLQDRTLHETKIIGTTPPWLCLCLHLTLLTILKSSDAFHTNMCQHSFAIQEYIKVLIIPYPNAVTCPKFSESTSEKRNKELVLVIMHESYLESTVLFPTNPKKFLGNFWKEQWCTSCAQCHRAEQRDNYPVSTESVHCNEGAKNPSAVINSCWLLVSCEWSTALLCWWADENTPEHGRIFIKSNHAGEKIQPLPHKDL